MLRNGLLSIFVGLALVASACGGGGSTQDDAGVGDGGGPQFDRMQSDQGGGQDDATVGDNNDSFDQAIQMDFTQTGYTKTGTINPKGDLDYYKFEGTAGDWVAIFTDANPDCSETKVDPVVTLYNASQAKVAENDDQILGYICDPFLITRLETTGTYYIKVQDWYTFYYPTDSAEWKGGPLYTYKLYIAKLDDTQDGVTVDPETGNDLASAKALEFPTDSAGSLLGTFAGNSDKDVFTFTLANNASLFIEFALNGVDGNGSTATTGKVYLTDSTGATILARVDGAAGMNEIAPPQLAAGSYALWVEAPAGTLGANAFYTASNYTSSTDNPPEAEAATATGSNDTLATAEAVTESTTSAGVYYILAHLPTGDVDYFKVPVTQGDEFYVNCGSRTIGSGIQGLTISLRNASDTEVATCTENTTDMGCKIGTTGNEVTVAATGFYYVKMSKTGQESDVASDFIRCVFVSQAP